MCVLDPITKEVTLVKRLEKNSPPNAIQWSYADAAIGAFMPYEEELNNVINLSFASKETYLCFRVGAGKYKVDFIQSLQINMLTGTEREIINEPKKIALSSKEKKAEEKKSKDAEPKLCQICFIKKPEVVFIPCGHFGTCITCAEEISKKKKVCPFCKLPFKEITKLFQVAQILFN
eukprot:TRINITY_DN3928_c0_g1_i1.p1 TRINITY_DN3928_c0_g1~~TRINITY_DN3928_c0_g1_i1.p1  ORF type:complete len:176 (+),score=37.11 TRINITY_DN3928_c0_g1_i1:202-729(+)